MGTQWRSPNLCTVRLSRALYPEMPRHNLDAVMERHGIHIENRHRAMPDAQVLLAFWRKLRADWPAEELQRALDLAGRAPRCRRRCRRTCPTTCRRNRASIASSAPGMRRRDSAVRRQG